MRTLTPAERRALRAKAHHLSAFASVGQGGLTPSVLHEIDVSLRAHELVKIRVFAAERDDREAMLVQICEALDAAPVQHLGKVLIVWRPAPPGRGRAAARAIALGRQAATAGAPPALAAAAHAGASGARRAAAARAARVGAAPPGTILRSAATRTSPAAPVAGRRNSTYTPKTTPKSFSAKPNPRSAWEKKPPAPRGGKPAGSRTSGGKPRGGKPLGFTRGAKPAGTTRGARPAATLLRLPERAGAASRRSKRRPSGVAHRENFVLAHAARGLDFGGVALGLADERARDRRADRNLAVLEVGLVVADDLVGDPARPSPRPRARPSRRTPPGRRRP